MGRSMIATYLNMSNMLDVWLAVIIYCICVLDQYFCTWMLHVMADCKGKPL